MQAGRAGNKAAELRREKEMWLVGGDGGRGRHQGESMRDDGLPRVAACKSGHSIYIAHEHEQSTAGNGPAW